MVVTKLCTKCGKTGEFCKDKHTRDGLSCWCKVCRSSKHQDWAAQNPAKAKESNRKATLVYREANLDKTRAASRKYMASKQANAPEEMRANKRARYAKNPSKDKARSRAYQQSHPDWVRHHQRKRRAWKAKVPNTLTSQQWEEVLTAYEHKCAYCERSDLPLTLDHVVPLSKGGPHTQENVVPACQPCNSSKGSRVDWSPVKTSTYTSGSTATGEPSSC